MANLDPSQPTPFFSDDPAPSAGVATQTPSDNPPMSVQGAPAPPPPSQPNPAMPTLAPQSPAQPAPWKSILMGALSGLAGAAGAKSFGGGLAQGAAGYIENQQRQVVNAQNQQQLDERQQQINQQGLQVKFASQESAARIAAASADERRRDALFQEHTTALDNLNAGTLAQYKALGIQPVLVTTTDAEDAKGALEQAGKLYPNGVPPLSTLQVGHSIYVFDASKIAATNTDADRKLVNDALFEQTGNKQTYGNTQWYALDPRVRAAKVDAAMQYNSMSPANDLTPKTVDAAIARTRNQLATFAYNAHPSADTERVAANLKAELKLYTDYKNSLEADADKAADRQADVKIAAYQAKLAAAAAGAGDKAEEKLRGQFKKNLDSLNQTEQSYQQFADVLKDIDSGKDITGAQSVTSLFNAIGLSATPLKGMGFRINNSTVAEHANARGLGEGLYQKLLSLKSGDVITPQQIKDYANIAAQARANAYVSTFNEAANAGAKDPSFVLPRGNGSHIDPNTASIFVKAANGDAAKARQMASARGWSF